MTASATKRIRAKRATSVTAGGHSDQRLVRRIVRIGGDPYESHRGNFETCPHCGYEMQSTEWDKYAVTLILEPRNYKAGCVAVAMECPKCFENSWVHARMDGCRFEDEWPQDWRDAVEVESARLKLASLREWGATLCHNCKRLTGGKVEYHCWRDCIKGSGPAEKACDKYQKLDSPNEKLRGGDQRQ